MSLTFIDSLWFAGEQEQGWNQDTIVFERVVFTGHKINDLDIVKLPDYGSVERYFTHQEPGNGLYDPSVKLITFTYGGNREHSYFFYDDKAYTFVINLLGSRVTRKNLDANISRKVISVGDLGLAKPVLGVNKKREVIGESDQLVNANGIEDEQLSYLNRSPYQPQDLYEEYGNELILFNKYGQDEQQLPMEKEPAKWVDDPRRYYFGLLPSGSRV